MNQIVTRGLKTGLTLAAATTATMAISSLFKSKSPFAGINAMATAVGVGGRRPSKSFGAVATPAGLGVLVGGMLLWGLGYEAALSAAGRRSSLFTGALSALGGYAFDRLVMPDHLVPNFKKTMGTLGTIAKYTALGVASAMSSRAVEEVVSAASERIHGGADQAGDAASASSTKADGGGAQGAGADVAGATAT